MAVDIGSAKGYLELDISRFTSSLAAANGAVASSMTKMNTTFSSKMAGLGTMFTSVGSKLTKSLTVPIATAVGSAVKITASFDKSMSKVQALTKASGEELDILRNKAREMGKTTVYSATEAADAMGYMGLAGWSTKEIVEGLDGVLNLAAASDMELAEASDIVTDYLTAFGLEAKDATKMADEMSYAQANSNTTTRQLGEAFRNSAANMHTAGQSMETTTALLASMANQGTKGARAGTQLAAVVRDITHKMKDGAIQIGKTKIAVQDSNGNFRNMIDIMADVEKATDGMGSAQKTAALSSVFTARSISAVSQVLNEGTESTKAFENELKNAGGTAEEMSKQMLDNLLGDLKLFKSALQDLAISIGDVLMPKLREFTQKLTDLTNKFNAMSEEQKKTILKIAGIIAAIGPAFLVLGKVAKTLSAISNAFKLLATGAGGLVGSLVPFLAIVGAIAGAVYLIKTNWSELKPMFKDLGVTVKNFGKSFVNTFKNLWKSIKPSIDKIGKAFVSLIKSITTLIPKILEVFRPVINGIVTLVQKMAPVVANIFDSLVKVITNLINALGPILDAITGVLNEVMPVIVNALGTIGQVVSNLVTTLTPLINEIVNLIANIVVPLIQGLAPIITTVLNTIMAVVTPILNSVMNIIRAVVNAIRPIIEMLQKILPPIIDAVMKAIQTVMPIIQKVGEVLGSIFGIIGNIVSYIVEFVTPIIEAVADVIGSVLVPVFEALEGVIDVVCGIFEALWDVVKTVLGIFFDFGDETDKEKGKTKSFGETMKNLKKTMKAVGDFIKTYITPIFEGIGKSFKLGIDEIGDAVKVGKKLLEGDFDGACQAAEDAVMSWGDQTAGILNTVTEGLFGFSATTDEWAEGFEQFFSDVGDFFENWGDNIMTVLKDIGGWFSDLWDGITGGVGEVEGVVANASDKMVHSLAVVPKQIKKTMQIHSPSKVMMYIGEMMGAGLTIGWEKEIDKMLVITDKSAGALATNFWKGYKKKEKNVQSVIDDIKKKLAKARKEEKEKQVKHYEEKLKVQKAKLKKLKENRIQAAEETLDYYKKYHDTSLQYEIDYWAKIVKTQKKGTKQYKEAAENLKEVKYEMQQQLKELDEDYKSSVQDVATSLKKSIDDVNKAYEDAVNSRAEQISSSMSLFDEFTSTTEYTAEQLISNLQSQVDALQEWQDNIAALKARNLPEGFAEQIESMGISSLANLKLLVNMTDEQLEQYISLWKQKGSLAYTQALGEVDRSKYDKQIQDLITEANAKLEEITVNYNNKLAELGSKFRLAGVKIGENFIQGMSESLSLESTGKIFTTSSDTVVKWSGKMVNISKDTGNKFSNSITTSFTKMNGTVKEVCELIIQGVQSWSKRVVNLGKDTGRKFINAFRTATANAYYEGSYVGQQIVNGVIAGINSRISALLAAIAEMVRLANERAQMAAEVGSPSRLFARTVGRWIPLGIAAGVEEYTPEATKQMQKTFDTAFSKLDTDVTGTFTVETDIDSSVKDTSNILKSTYEKVAIWFETIEGRIGSSIDRMRDQLGTLIDESQMVVNNDGTLGYVGYGGGFKQATQQDSLSMQNANKPDNERPEGNTYVFYTQKEINELEASRLMKQTERDISAGFF